MPIRDSALTDNSIEVTPLTTSILRPGLGAFQRAESLALDSLPVAKCDAYLASLNMGRCYERLFAPGPANAAYLRALSYWKLHSDCEGGNNNEEGDIPSKDKLRATCAAASVFLRSGEVFKAHELLSSELRHSDFEAITTTLKASAGFFGVVQALTCFMKSSPLPSSAVRRMRSALTNDEKTHESVFREGSVIIPWVLFLLESTRCSPFGLASLPDKDGTSSSNHARLDLIAVNSCSFDHPMWGILDNKVSLHCLLTSSSAEPLPFWPTGFVLPEAMEAASLADSEIDASQNAVVGMEGPKMSGSRSQQNARHEPRWVSKSAAGWGGHGVAFLGSLPRGAAPKEEGIADTFSVNVDRRLSMLCSSADLGGVSTDWLLQRYVSSPLLIKGRRFSVRV